MYKTYIDSTAKRIARFGGDRSDTDWAGAFYLRLDVSSTFFDAFISSRLIMFGD